MTQENQETQNEEVDLVRNAFQSAVEANAEEDSVKLAMITAGATFKNVARLFNQYMIDAGLALSKEDRDILIEQAIEEVDVADEEGFVAASASLQESAPGLTERSACALVRAYCKKHEVECYAKPKSDGTGRIGFVSKYHDFLVSNPRMTKEEATAYVMGTGDHEETSANVQKHIGVYMNHLALVNRIAAKLDEA